MGRFLTNLGTCENLCHALQCTTGNMRYVRIGYCIPWCRSQHSGPFTIPGIQGGMLPMLGSSVHWKSREAKAVPQNGWVMSKLITSYIYIECELNVEPRLLESFWDAYVHAYRERVYLASFRFIFYIETNMFLVKFCRNLDWWRNHLQTWFRGVWVWRFVDFPPKLLLMCKNWTWCFYLGLDWLREG